MKIGIVTLPLIDNYGCILQNYALQQVLIKLGHSPITLDIRGKKLYRRIFTLVKRILNNPFNKTSYFIPNKQYSRSDGFQSFIDANIQHSPPLYSYSSSVCKRYDLDAVITGSDQVWRFGYSLFPKDMFLKFVPDNILKISYAASFGTDKPCYPPRKYKDYALLLDRFKGVSVREESGINICKEYFGHDSLQVLDPTLLLEAADYIALCNTQVKDTQSYLGIYFLDETQNKFEIIKIVANKLRLPVRIFNTKGGSSPTGWLDFYRNASFILTDSFHGAVFSLIFNIQFLVIDNPNRGSSRFDSLLSTFNLRERLITNIDTNNFVIPHTIDYDDVNKILSKRKIESIRFIQESLQ